MEREKDRTDPELNSNAMVPLLECVATTGPLVRRPLPFWPRCSHLPPTIPLEVAEAAGRSGWNRNQNLDLRREAMMSLVLLWASLSGTEVSLDRAAPRLPRVLSSGHLRRRRATGQQLVCSMHAPLRTRFAHMGKKEQSGSMPVPKARVVL